MTFFDYPDSHDSGDAAPAPDLFLPGATDREWAVLLEYCQRSRFAPGEGVISAGTRSRSLYLVVEGSLEVFAPTRRGGPKYRKLTTLGPGSVLGEMSFFDNAERSALVRAATAVEVAELSFPRFEALAREHPALARDVLFDLGRTLAQRLRRAQSTEHAFA